MVGQNTPIDIVMARASSVPKFVYDESSRVQAGITGADILWENGRRDAGVDLPSITTGSRLFLGVNREYKQTTEAETGKAFELADFSGRMIVSKFPTIAREVFDGVTKVNVVYEPGSTEATQYVYDDCKGIVDVIASGATAAANDIDVVAFILDPVAARMIEKPDLTSKQERLLTDFTQQLL